MSRISFGSIDEAVAAQPLFDTHEHLIPEGYQNQQRIDLLSSWLTHYASSDLVSAGLPPDDLETARDIDRPANERWALIAPYWPHVRTTGYGRALLLAARDLFGIDDINDRTWAELSARITAANRPGWYHEVLRRRANIEAIVHDNLTHYPAPEWLADPTENGFYLPACRIEGFALIENRGGLDDVAASTGLAIASLGDLEAALTSSFERALGPGRMRVLKIGLAYSRTIRFDNVPRADAVRSFERVAADAANPSSPVPFTPSNHAKPLQDYLVHRTIQLAIENGLPIQIHTGLQEGNGNFLENSRPTLLTNLFLRYPDARFDIFHAGYPYSGEVAALAKNFPGVYADLCWVHIISPTVGRRVLREWIETIPSNKIFAFGGDYLFVEGAYAHSKMARVGVARVLSEIVADEYLTQPEALALVPKLLHDNAAYFFGAGASASSR